MWPGIILWLLTPRAFLHMCGISHTCVVSPSSFTQCFFPSLCPCYDYSLEVLARDKHWLFTLILLLLPNVNANGGAGCKFLNYSPPISQEMQIGDWLIANV